MRFIQMIPALFAASTLAAKWEGFSDISCQRYSGDYKLVTVAEQQKIILDAWAGTSSIPETSRAFSPRGSCPSNSDDTYKWVSCRSVTIFSSSFTAKRPFVQISVPQWRDVPTRFGSPQGGSIAVVYFKETDTYHNCGYLSSVQPNGYKGNCK
jgi:hypothetical protein